jgi:hypothetical protein
MQPFRQLWLAGSSNDVGYRDQSDRWRQFGHFFPKGDLSYQRNSYGHMRRAPDMNSTVITNAKPSRECNAFKSMVEESAYAEPAPRPPKLASQ